MGVKKYVKTIKNSKKKSINKILYGGMGKIAKAKSPKKIGTRVMSAIQSLGGQAGGPKISGALSAVSALAGGPKISGALGAVSALAGGPKISGALSAMGAMGSLGAMGAPKSSSKGAVFGTKMASIGASIASTVAPKSVIGGLGGNTAVKVAQGVVTGAKKIGVKVTMTSIAKVALAPTMEGKIRVVSDIAKKNRKLVPNTVGKIAKVVKSPAEVKLAVSSMLKGFSLPKSIKSVSGTAAALAPAAVQSQIKSLLAAAKTQ